jgi:heme o synthase
MWWDADIDAGDARTARRPVPSGKVQPVRRWLGLALSGISVVMLALATNLLAAGLLAFTIFFYAVVYSMWLKRLDTAEHRDRRGAGAFPPMIGWVRRRVGQDRSGADVRADLHVDAAAFLGAGAVHEGRLPHRRRADADGDAWPPRDAGAYPCLHLRWCRLRWALALTSIGGPMIWRRGPAEPVVLVGAFRIWQRDEAQAEADKLPVEKKVFRFSLLLPLPALRRLPGRGGAETLRAGGLVR